MERSVIIDKLSHLIAVRREQLSRLTDWDNDRMVRSYRKSIAYLTREIEVVRDCDESELTPVATQRRLDKFYRDDPIVW